jgi:CheY-like chemotaxis protein
VTSVEGEGSTFTIDLRAGAMHSQDILPAPEAVQTADVGILRGRMVLIIDDDADARTLIAHQVASLGGRSAAAASGADGLRLARTLQPDLITLDLLLPGMDGRQIMEAFKEDPELAGIPIVVVSIVAREQGSGLVGAVSALPKPLDRSELTQALKHALGLGRVLVVDDDADTQHLLSGYVFEAGAAQVRVSSNGQAAVAALDEFKPDLVLLDLLMPNGDGEMVLEAIARRAEPGRDPCSVIVVTSKELTAGEVRRFELATLGVLHKGAALESDLRRALNEFAAARRRNSPSRPIVRAEINGDD